MVEPGTFIKPCLLGEGDTALKKPPKFLFQKEDWDIWKGETEKLGVLTWSLSTMGTHIRALNKRWHELFLKTTLKIKN